MCACVSQKDLYFSGSWPLQQSFSLKRISWSFCLLFVQKEIEILKAKLVFLEAKDQQLSKEIEEQDKYIRAQDSELSALLSWLSLQELQAISKALADISEASHTLPCSLDLPESIKRYSLDDALKSFFLPLN